MAVLYITEYASTGLVTGSHVPVAQEPPLAEQTVAIGVAAQSAALNVNTGLVRLHTDAICSILFGANPTAAVTNRRMAANTTEYVAIDRQRGTDSLLKVGVITNT